MIPKKPNKIYKIVSEDLNVQENLIEDIIQFYYKDLRNKIATISHTRINLEGLGHMLVKPQLVSKAIDRLEKSVKNHDVSTYNAYHNKKAKEEKLDLLKKVIVKLKQEQENKIAFKQNKDENSTKSNLGE